MTKIGVSAVAVGLLTCAFTVNIAHSQGVTKTTILIGHSGPLSGANKEFGEDIRDGALAYFSKVNAAGGINGRKLELLTLDDANDAKRSGENGRKLIEERSVLALFGYASATLSLPALPFAEKHKVPFVAPFTGAEPMRVFKRQVYNIRASYADELEKIIEFYTSTGMKKFAVLHYSDAVGKENLGAVEVALAKRGLKPVSVSAVPRNQTDLGNAVSGAVQASPDVIIATTLYRTTADFVKLAKKAGSGAQIASTSFVGASALANELGPLGTGVVVARSSRPTPSPRSKLSRNTRRRSRSSSARKTIPLRRWKRISAPRFWPKEFAVPAPTRLAKDCSRPSIQFSTTTWAVM